MRTTTLSSLLLWLALLLLCKCRCSTVIHSTVVFILLIQQPVWAAMLSSLLLLLALLLCARLNSLHLVSAFFSYSQPSCAWSQHFWQHSLQVD
jgi:hypothetical protein